MSKSVSTFAAFVLPFLVVLAGGIVFDKKTGGDPFYATTMLLFFLSPLWLLLGFILSVVGLKNAKVRRAVLFAAGVLLLFIVVESAIIRAINAN